MNNEFVKLFQEYNSHIELGMSKDIQAFFKGRDDIKNYVINADKSQKILINIKLKNFSKLSAKKLFSEFICFVGYDGINLYICDSAEQQVKYLYLTIAVQHFNGVKMEMIIE